MKGMDFIKLINDIDEDLIQESETGRKHKEFRTKYLLISAAVMGAVLIALVIFEISLATNKKEILHIVEIEETTEIDVQKETEPAEKETVIINLGNDENVIDKETSDATEDHYNIEDTQAGNNEESEETDPAWSEEPEPDSFQEIPEYRVMGIYQTISEEEEDVNEGLSLEMFWNDGKNCYYMPADLAACTYVMYENGETESVIAALSAGHIYIWDLDAFGITYYTE